MIILFYCHWIAFNRLNLTVFKLVSSIFVSKESTRNFLFYWKIWFCSQDIQIFVLSYFPLFSPVRHCWIYRGNWLKINVKVYRVVMWIYIGIFLNILRSKEGLMVNLGRLIKYYTREIFVEKYAEKCNRNYFQISILF